MLFPLPPHLKISARQISIFLLLSLSLSSWLPLAGAKASPTQEQDKEAPRNDKARKVKAESPRQDPPMANLPNLDEVKGRRDPDPEAPAPRPSTMRSKRKAPESRRGNTFSSLSPARATDGKSSSGERVILARTGSRGTNNKAARSHHAITRRIVNDRLGASRNALALEPIANSGDSANARIDPLNQPGNQLLARDAEWSLPLVSLPGRAGLDLGLGLSYSSLVWTRAGDYIYFDGDHGTPSPGFRLGFPIVQGVFVDTQAGVNARLLITSGGRRIELRQVGSSNIYEAADSSYLQLIDYGSSLLVRSTDGTQMSYAQFGIEWHCTQIKDRNGNYISVNYNGSGDITNITDTLGRVINFNYDGNANLISITQTWNGQTHTWATFGWSTHTMSLGFSVSVVGTYQGEAMPVLTQVGLDDGSRFNFEYTGAGQVNVIRRYRSDIVQSSFTTYDYNNASDDCPRLSQTRVWVENWTGVNGVPTEVVTQFSDPGDGSHVMTAPDGTIYKEFYGTGWQKGLVTHSEVWSGGVKQKWTDTLWTQDNTSVNYEKNPRVFLHDIYDSAANMRRTVIAYYAFTLPTGSTFSVPHDVLEYQADATTIARHVYTQYNWDASYINRHVIGLPLAKYLYQGNDTVVAKTTYTYDLGGEYLQDLSTTPIQHDSGYSTSLSAGRGNLVAVRRWDVTDPNNSAKAPETKMGYDIDGSLIFTRDHLSHQSNVSYTDGFSDSVNRNTFAYPTTVTDADGFSSTVQYNYYFGAKTRAQGPPPAGQTQGAIQTIAYDSAARIQQVTTTNNGAYKRYVYGPNYVQSFGIVNNVADDAYAISVFDGAGRSMGTVTNHPGSAGGYSMVNVIYDQMGRAVKQSNPTEISGSWVPSGDDAAGVYYTQQSYDWKGRPLVTTNTDGTQKYASYGGCGCAGGEVVTLTDEVGRQQKSYSDVLGRAWKTEILNDDDSVYSTTVSVFNARDQVRVVNQYSGAAPSDASSTNAEASCPDGSCQKTTMAYDGYGRLQTKHAPQQNAGTATVYAYNSDDTIQSVTDARGAIATYGYNNRRLVTSISYSAPYGVTATAPIGFGYDAAGNRTSMSDGLGSVSYNYDSLSRLTSESRTFNGVGTYALSYQYNLANELTSIADPFGAALTYAFDSTGRLNSVSGSGYSSVTQFASNMQYRAWGGLKGVTYDSTRSLTISYNSRMNPTLFGIVGQLYTAGSEYQYYADGRISYSHDLTDDRFDRSYSYDHIARLTSSFSGSEARGGNLSDGPYRQTYGYDAWGNLNQRTGRDWSHNSAPVSFTYDSSTNRNSQWQYDAEGNVVGQGTWHYSYDASGQQVGTSQTGGSAASQAFDGDGFKVRNSYPGWVGYTLRSSALNGAVVAELNAQGQPWRSFIYANGQVLAEQDDVYPQVVWKHRSPSNNSEFVSLTSSTGGSRLHEYDPMGTEFGVDDPYLDGGSGGYGDWTGGRGVPSDLTTGCSWEGMAIGCEFALKFTNWRGYTSGGLRIMSKTIPGVGIESSQLAHVKSRVIGAQDESWSSGDIIDYKNFISRPDSYQTSIVRTQGARTKKSTQEHKEPCSAIVHLAGADTNEGALERLLYQEATPHSKSEDYSSKEALDEMGAIAGSVLNRVAFLGTPGLTQGQTMGFGNTGASIADVVYSRGNNPYPNKRTGKYTPIATQYAGFTPDGIDSDIQTRINNALNSNVGDADCTKLLHAYLIGQLGMDARVLDPFHGQTMGMRTAPVSRYGTPFANSVLLGQLGKNNFFGLKR